MIDPKDFEQQPFEPLAEDARIVGLARERYATDVIEVDVDAEVYRGDDGAWVEALVFVPKEEIEQFGKYEQPTEETEHVYAPGPEVVAAMEQLRNEQIEDVRRAVNLGMMDYEAIQKQPKPLWERIATSTFTILMVLLCSYYWGTVSGESHGYKKGVADVAAAIRGTLQ